MSGKLEICSVSGGKDSTALYCLMVEFYGHDFLPIFADTGNEHPVTVNYVRNLHTMAGGPEVVIVKGNFDDKLIKKGIEPSGNAFLDMMMWKGRAPSSKAQFCTEWVKLYPQLLYLEEHYGDKEWIMHTGIRAGESIARQKRQPFSWNTYFDCEEILPMLYETEEQVFEFLFEKQVPPNPLYAAGFTRVGCYPCIHANKTQISKLEDWAFTKLAEWEKKIGRTWFGPGTVPGVHIPSIEQVKEWSKTSHGGKQYNLFSSQDTADVPSCMSGWGACE